MLDLMAGSGLCLPETFSLEPLNFTRTRSPMARHTQAHLTRKFERFRSDAYKEQKKEQMQYYMGAKLLEVGIDPNNVIYRWAMQVKGNQEEWTISAYWGDSKDQLLQEEGNQG